MADDDDSSNKPKSYRPQETFQRAQETQVEHRFPNNPTGVVQLPRGCQAPKSLYIKKHAGTFGFTLRHFIFYPPDSIVEQDQRYGGSGLSQAIETIFVINVQERGPAKQAGLQRGDRILWVNKISCENKSYAEVVQLISQSPEYLHLLVLPKENDVLQQYLSQTAYNPVSNLSRPTANQQQQPKRREFQLDDVSWRSLQQQPYYGAYPVEYDWNQRSADNINNTRGDVVHQEIYAEIHPNELTHRQRSRAQPQVPLYKKMGRRASAGYDLSSRRECYAYDGGYYDLPDRLNSATYSNPNMNVFYKQNQATDMPGLNYPGCRLSLDVGRRESSSSLSSSLADGSKDSLASFDSTSTLTSRGETADDSAYLDRMRKSFQRKEEFLSMPNTNLVMHREFYAGQPKKLEKSKWQPVDSPSRIKPTHHNFMRVKHDIENERDLILQPQKNANPPFGFQLERIYEASTAPEEFEKPEAVMDERRLYSPTHQTVHKRAKDFESGRAMPDDDPVLANRTNFSRSELARLSSKRLVPNVIERAQEYEIKSEPRRTNSGTSTNSGNSTLKRIQRDSRSLDSSDTSDHEAFKTRARSNSVESCRTAAADGKRISRQNANASDRHHQAENEAMDISGAHANYADLPPLIPEPVERIHLTPTVSITPAPSIVNHSKALRPTQLDLDSPVRPTRHLKPPSSNVDTPVRRSISPVTIEDKPVVVMRRIKNTNLAEDERAMRRESYLKATEGGRMHIDSDISDGDISPHVLRSAHRRWRPPMFLGDIQQLRKLFEDGASSYGGSASGNSSSSASLDREKSGECSLEKEKDNTIREGSLHCKILGIDGKRFTDRSWKQTWLVLKGPKLFLHKDRHHQSPIGTSDALEQSLVNGVDMRTSVVRVAEDYTKRKNVLRVSAVKPCRSEFLLQADSTEDFADWVKTLQEQVAASTDAELESNNGTNSKQQAVPQLVPASTSIQVQGSQLQVQQKSAKAVGRNRSPTGQSPVSKSRKASQVPDPTSPKTKTWRGRVAKQFRKIQHGASSPSSPTAPEGSTFGIALEQCLPSNYNQFVPRFVEVCTEIVEEKGLQTIGIYRVPGNNASITALTEETNRNYDDVPTDDPRWNDLHVVSSLLKSYFRKMPDSLVTAALYPRFIQADQMDNPQQRLEELRRLVKSLPPHNYHTLKHIILHLTKVVANSEVNKMEGRNLAIVFGPTIVRTEGENMANLVMEMTNQCKIVETLLGGAEWFFSENIDDEVPPPIAAVPEVLSDDYDTANSLALLENISKIEALKDPKEKNTALFTSILSAAQRVKRKKASKHESKYELPSPTTPKTFAPQQPYLISDLKEVSTSPDGKIANIPTTVSEIEKANKSSDKAQWFNYQRDKDDYHRRIENFRQETEAMLQRPRKTEIPVNSVGTFSSSASNVNQSNRLSRPPDLTKTHSASNVYSRTATTSGVPESSRNSLTTFPVQYSNQNTNSNHSQFKSASVNSKQYSEFNHSDTNQNTNSDTTDGYYESKLGRTFRRGSSVENISTSSMDLNANGGLKKLKFESELDGNHRSGSLDSIHKISTVNDDDSDLVNDITKIFDQKLKEDPIQLNLLTAGDDLPFVDESPIRNPRDMSSCDKENVPRASDLYKNPSLHKNQSKTTTNAYKQMKESNSVAEKEEDTMSNQSVPDNERHISSNKLTLFPLSNNKLSLNLATTSKLKRSESLNKADKLLPLNNNNNNKLKRSESLNKTGGDRLKRSDSLSKTEKTENNLNKRREITTSGRRAKEVTKLKRKNGMPDRSIKRRHTVGGTKDPDKVTWLDNKYQQELTSSKDNQKKEKNLRTSSPDLSSTRRERFCLEISFIGPENMVVQLRDHLIGPARPQSFPEPPYSVPLESHV